jgi:hypothetical protein
MFRKSQIRKFADFNFLKYVAICRFVIYGSFIFAFCGFAILQAQFFSGFKTSANPQIHTVVFLTNLSLNCSHSNFSVN